MSRETPTSTRPPVSFKTFATLGAVLIPLLLVSWWMGQQSYGWLPPQASAESLLVDSLFSFMVSIGSFIFLGVAGALGYSVLFQRASKYDTSDGPPIEGNLWAEIIWTAIPFALVVWIATYSFQVYDQMDILSSLGHSHGAVMLNELPQDPAQKSSAAQGSAVTPAGPNDPAVGDVELGGVTLLGPEPSSQSIGGLLGNGLTGETVAKGKAIAETSPPLPPIDVYSRQWAWEFRYDNGVTSTELHLPVNQRVNLRLRSADVIHGFYIPAFRVKQDIVPNEITSFAFTPIREGRYRLRDSLYSGTYFAAMQTDVVVQSQEAYDAWLQLAAATPPAAAYNPAYAEYRIKMAKEKPPGWVTVPPAEPPVVNFSAPLQPVARAAAPSNG